MSEKNKNSGNSNKNRTDIKKPEEGKSSKGCEKKII
jgi:hypothetical protein